MVNQKAAVHPLKYRSIRKALVSIKAEEIFPSYSKIKPRSQVSPFFQRKDNPISLGDFFCWVFFVGCFGFAGFLGGFFVFVLGFFFVLCYVNDLLWGKERPPLVLVISLTDWEKLLFVSWVSQWIFIDPDFCVDT